MKYITHQLTLFDYNAMRPRLKVPISAARIREAKALMAKGDARGAEEKMRDVRERLEDFERRITNGNEKIS